MIDCTKEGCYDENIRCKFLDLILDGNYWKDMCKLFNEIIENGQRCKMCLAKDVRNKYANCKKNNKH